MSAARARGGQLVVENVALLSGGSAAFEAKYKVPLSDDSFRKPGNTKAAFPLLHFLLTHISPQDAAAFRPCFPVLDRDQERDFRKLCDARLADLERQKLLPATAAMRKTTLAAAGGDKFEQLVWDLSTLALKQAALRHPAYSTSSIVDDDHYPTLPSPNADLFAGSSSTTSSNRRYAALLRARIASERAAFARTTQTGRDSTARWTREIQALKDRIADVENRSQSVKDDLKTLGYDPDIAHSNTNNTNNMVLKTSPIESDGSFDDNDSYNADLNGLLPFTADSGHVKEAESIVSSLSEKSTNKSSLGTIFNPSVPDAEAKSCANVAQLVEAAIESLETATKKMIKLASQDSVPGDISDISRDTSLETVDTGDTRNNTNKLTEQTRKSLSLHQAILESTNCLAETAKSVAAQKSRSRKEENNSNIGSFIAARKQQFEPKQDSSGTGINYDPSRSNASLPSPRIDTFNRAQDSKDITALARFANANNNNSDNTRNNNTTTNINHKHNSKSPPPPTLVPSPQWITDATQGNNNNTDNNMCAEYNEETEAMSWELMDVDTDPDTKHIKEEEDIDIDITIPVMNNNNNSSGFLNTVQDLQKAHAAINYAKNISSGSRKSALRKTSRSSNILDSDVGMVVPFHHVAAKSTSSRRKKSGKMVRFAELPPSYTASKSAAAAASTASASNNVSKTITPNAKTNNNNNSTKTNPVITAASPSAAGAGLGTVRILDDNASTGSTNNNNSSHTTTTSRNNNVAGNVPSTHILTRSSTAEEEDAEREREVLTRKGSTASSNNEYDDAQLLTRDEDYVGIIKEGTDNNNNTAPVANTRLLRVKQPPRRNTPRHLASRRAIVIRNAISDRHDSTVNNTNNTNNSNNSNSKLLSKNGKKSFVVVGSRRNNNNNNDKDIGNNKSARNNNNNTPHTSGDDNKSNNNSIIINTGKGGEGNSNRSKSIPEMSAGKVEMRKGTVEPSRKELAKKKEITKDNSMVPRKPTVIIMNNTQSIPVSVSDDLEPDINSAPDLGKLMNKKGGDTDEKSVVKVLSNEFTPAPVSNNNMKVGKQRRHSVAHRSDNNSSSYNDSNTKSGRSSRGLRNITKGLPDRKMKDPDSDLDNDVPQARRSISTPDYVPGSNIKNKSNNTGNNNSNYSTNNMRQTSATGRLTSFTNMYGKRRMNRKNKNNNSNNKESEYTGGIENEGDNNEVGGRRRASIAGEDAPMFSWLNSGDKRSNINEAVERSESKMSEDVNNNLQRKNSSFFSGSRRSSVFSRNRDRGNNNNSNGTSLPFFRKDRGSSNNNNNKPNRVKALRDRIAALL